MWISWSPDIDLKMLRLGCNLNIIMMICNNNYYYKRVQNQSFTFSYLNDNGGKTNDVRSFYEGGSDGYGQVFSFLIFLNANTHLLYSIFNFV